MSLLKLLSFFLGGSSDDSSESSDEGRKRSHHGHHEGRHGRGPQASDTVRHGAVEADSYSRKAEMKNNSETVEGPKKIEKRRRD